MKNFRKIKNIQKFNDDLIMMNLNFKSLEQ